LNKRLLLVLLGAAHSLNHSLFLILPPLLNTIAKELGASLEIIGFLVTVSGLIYGAGALIGGPWSDRLGEVKVIRTSLALSGASTLMFIVARDVITFSVGLLLMAVGASLYHPTANNLISKVFQAKTAEAMGLHGVGGNVGFMFTPSIAVVLGLAFGWRVSYVFFGLLSLLVSFLFLLTPYQTARNKSVENRIFHVFKIPGLWILIVFGVVIGLYSQGIGLFFPTFLSQRRGFSVELAAHAATFILVLGTIGQWLGGRAADLIGCAKIIVALSVSVLAGLLLLLFVPNPLMGVFLFILLYGVASYGQQPPLTVLAGLIAPEEERGAAYGVFFFFTFGLGSVSTTLAGYYAERYSLDAAFHAMALISLVALLLSFLIPARIRHPNKGSPNY